MAWASSARPLWTRTGRHGRPGGGAGRRGRPRRGSWPGPGPGRPHRHHGPHAQYGFHQRLEDLHRRGRQPPLPLPARLADQGTPGRRRGAGLHDPGAARRRGPGDAASGVPGLVAGQPFVLDRRELGGGTTSQGRLLDGRPYLRTVSDSADRYHFAGWSIDWGRPCLTGAARCVPYGVGFQVHATDGGQDRYRAVAETIPPRSSSRGLTAPTVGTAACRPAAPISGGWSGWRSGA